MATKILGPTGSRRRRRFLLVPILLVACTALFLIGSAQAVHDLQFQLDGNARSGSLRHHSRRRTVGAAVARSKRSTGTASSTRIGGHLAGE